MELVSRLLLILLVGLSEGQTTTHGHATTSASTTPHEPPGNQFNATFGDIMLVPATNNDGDVDVMKVMLYYRTWQHESGWGEICADNPGNNQETIAKAICQQYGRTGGEFHRDAVTAPVWLYNVRCLSTPTPHHILRCQYNTTSDEMCSTSLAVKCSKTKLTDSASRYSGQVFLCPPDDFTKNKNQSVSTGLVMVYLHESWQTINVISEDGDFGDFLDSVCQQLGYTNAVINSGTTVRALSAKYLFNSCNNSSVYPNTLAPSSWLTTADLDCGGSATACSSCCYRYPSSHCNDCDKMNNLVVSCTFDVLSKTPPTEGNSHMCAFHSNVSHSSLNSPVCPQAREIPLQTFEIVIGVVGPLALIFCLLAVIWFSCCCFCWYKRRHPERQPLVNRNRRNDDPGN